MKALGKYREEACDGNNGHQMVQGSLDSAKALSWSKFLVTIHIWCLKGQ